MCSECLSYYCPQSCPNYDGYSPYYGAPRAHCSLCDAPLYADDVYYDLQDERVCPECIEKLDIYELLELLGFEKVSEIIDNLGYEPTRA